MNTAGQQHSSQPQHHSLLTQHYRLTVTAITHSSTGSQQLSHTVSELQTHSQDQIQEQLINQPPQALVGVRERGENSLQFTITEIQIEAGKLQI